LVFITGTREQNHVYLSVRGDLWPYKIQQIRLRPGLRPGPRRGSLRRFSPDSPKLDSPKPVSPKPDSPKRQP